MYQAGRMLAVVLVVLAAGGAAAETVSYAYDDFGRLVRVTTADGTTLRYSYDDAGTLVSRVVSTDPGPFPIPPTLRVGKLGAAVELTYEEAPCPAADHAAFVGSLGDFTTAVAAECGIGSAGSATVLPPGGDVWFLVAGLDGSSYSSVGRSSAGERVLANVDTVCPSFVQDPSETCP